MQPHTLVCVLPICVHISDLMFTHPQRSRVPPPPALFYFPCCQKCLKPFRPFSSLCCSSTRIEERFLNDPLIIGSGVTLVFQLGLRAFLPPTLLSHPLYLSQVFKGLFFFANPPLLSPEWLFSPFVCAHEVECRKVSKSIFFSFKKKKKKLRAILYELVEMEPSPYLPHSRWWP